MDGETFNCCISRAGKLVPEPAHTRLLPGGGCHWSDEVGATRVGAGRDAV